MDLVVVRNAYALSNETRDILEKINHAIIDPLIFLMLALGMLVFMWGIVEFISGADNEEKVTQGKQHMVWGIIGIFIMLSAWGILRVICNTIGC